MFVVVYHTNRPSYKLDYHTNWAITQLCLSHKLAFVQNSPLKCVGVYLVWWFVFRDSSEGLESDQRNLIK